jgi:SAM-dependent methyltransferase
MHMTLSSGSSTTLELNVGKSNQFVFPWYASHIEHAHYGRVCVLGGVQHDGFTSMIDGGSFDFFDLSLGNWKINAHDWNIEQCAYDLVVCTRCACFADDPLRFTASCLELLVPNGKLFVDWGIGDHWRHQPYAIGWYDPCSGEQRSVAYDVAGQHHTSPLWSVFWDPELDQDQTALLFLEDVQRTCPRYVDRRLSDIIFEEVPSYMTFDDVTKLDCKCVDVRLLSLWPENPQLYILTLFTK